MRRLLALLLCLTALPAQAQLLGVQKTAGPPPASMTSPILAMSGCATAIPNGAQNYGPLAFGAISAQGCWGTSTTISGRGSIMPTAGTLSSLQVNFNGNIATGSYQITIYKNYAATLLTCSTLIDATHFSCSDTVNSFTVVAGDVIAIGETPTGTPTTTTVHPISMKFTSSSGTQEQPLFWGGALVNGPTTTLGFYPLVAPMTYNVTDLTQSSIIPTGGTIDNLWAQQSANSATGTFSYFLYKNGVQTALKCSTAIGQSQCSSSAQGTNTAVHFNAGDTASIEMCPSAGSALDTNCPTGATPTAVQPRGSARWVPDTAGEAIVAQVSSTMPPTSGLRYFALNGSGLTADTADVNGWNIAPAGMTIKKLWHAQSAAPGAGVTRTMTLRGGATAIVGTPGTSGSQAGQAVTCTVPSTATTTIGGVATSGCNDAANSYSAAVSGFVDWETSTSGTNAAVTWFKTSAVVTIP